MSQMYEVIFYMDDDNTHYVKVNESDLEWIRNLIDDDTCTGFIEVRCYDADVIFAINRKKVNAYSYKECENKPDE